MRGRSTSPGPGPSISATRAATAVLAGALVCWLGLAAVEALGAWLDGGAAGAASLAAAWRVALSWTAALLAPVWIFAAAVAGTSLLLPPGSARPARRRLRAIAVAAASGALAIHSYAALVGYRPFLWYPPFLAAAVLFAAILAAGHLDAPGCADGATPRRRLFGALWPLVGIAGFAAAHAANRRLYPGQYPTLHLAALLWAGGLLHLGASSLWMRLAALRPSRPSIIAAAGIVLALAAPAILAPRDAVEAARATAASSTALGGARLVGFEYEPAAEESARGRIAREPRPEEVLAAWSGLPRLPAGRPLDGLNVLLITSEATRHDQTSLHDAALGTTPNLAALAADGAFSFGRAFAPSSGTLHSIASLMCMTHPSMIRAETWAKPWNGRLLPEEETAAELFAAAGWDTFWVSHDHKQGFHRAITGFEQGFATTRFVYESGDGADSAETDARVADAAIAELGRRAGSGRRFFGWIFFASPHADYFAHYAEMPAGTAPERYRQEVRYMDEQLGRVLAALRERGLLERTIVVFAGDHGEEFGEHGGAHHKTTVYSESTWVPLVVRIPGVAGGRIDAPTSLTHLFPWLALGGVEPLGAAARERLSAELGPMLRATRGAVVVELIGHNRMISSLVYPTEKINYDFISERVGLFDTRADPLERAELLAGRPERRADVLRRIDAYKRIRGAVWRYILLPDKPTPEFRPASRSAALPLP